jgi:AAA family ATP:ADP antiporter
MPFTDPEPRPEGKSSLDRALSLFTDVRPGEGVTAVLMLINIFLLLICYSIIKIVREPLILVGGGAEVRSYAAAGQALVLMGFVPLYSWFASRVDRVKLLVGVTVFFVVCIELFALGSAAGVPYLGVAFFIWVGIFSISLVAQFWSFANDIYSKSAGERLFPMIMIGMTAGAPIGSFLAGHLFKLGFDPPVILQISAVLLATTLLLYLIVNRRETRQHAAPPAPLAPGGGFVLVLRSGYLRLIAVLIVLLNIVNTTGEYLVARLLTGHASTLAAADPAFNTQAYIGAFYGSYQFWVNVTALVLQAFVTSRLVKHQGLRGALLALPLIALGGYATIAAGASFAVVRWIKTAENATDYSIMNTARQLLWLPTTREEKYKAKQAIDTFFMRGGDLLSAAVVYVGAARMGIGGFAITNVVLTLIWIAVALLIVQRHRVLASLARAAAASAASGVLVGLMLLGAAAPASAQQTREEERAAAQAEKARHLHPWVPTKTERRLERIQKFLTNEPTFYPFIGSIFRGGWLAVGPGYRTRYAQSGLFDVHGAWSLKNYKAAEASLRLPQFADGSVAVDLRAGWLEAPTVAFYGVGDQSSPAGKSSFLYRTTTAGISARVRPASRFAVGGGADALGVDTGPGTSGAAIDEKFTAAEAAGLGAAPTYLRSRVFAEVDRRQSPGYTRRGGFYRVDVADYHQINDGPYGFRRVDAEVDQFIPLLRENWVIAMRAVASTTATARGNVVPYFLMPDLGGGSELRGYPSWRFRDRNRLLLTGEYRWMAGQFVDMALFVDAGKVAARWADIDLEGLKRSYGVGVRFHTPAATVMRIEVARTRDEGTSLILAFGPVF